MTKSCPFYPWFDCPCLSQHVTSHINFRWLFFRHCIPWLLPQLAVTIVVFVHLDYFFLLTYFLLTFSYTTCTSGSGEFALRSTQSVVIVCFTGSFLYDTERPEYQEIQGAILFADIRQTALLSYRCLRRTLTYDTFCVCFRDLSCSTVACSTIICTCLYVWSHVAELQYYYQHSSALYFTLWWNRRCWNWHIWQYCVTDITLLPFVKLLLI